MTNSEEWTLHFQYSLAEISRKQQPKSLVPVEPPKGEHGNADQRSELSDLREPAAPAPEVANEVKPAEKINSAFDFMLNEDFEEVDEEFSSEEESD